LEDGSRAFGNAQPQRREAGYACLAACRKIPIKMIDIDPKPALALATAGKLRVHAYDD